MTTYDYYAHLGASITNTGIPDAPAEFLAGLEPKPINGVSPTDYPTEELFFLAVAGVDVVLPGQPGWENFRRREWWLNKDGEGGGFVGAGGAPGMTNAYLSIGADDNDKPVFVDVFYPSQPGGDELATYLDLWSRWGTAFAKFCNDNWRILAHLFRVRVRRDDQVIVDTGYPDLTTLAAG